MIRCRVAATFTPDSAPCPAPRARGDRAPRTDTPVRSESDGAAVQEAHELHPLAQAALRHLPAGGHLGDQFDDLAGPEIEALVEALQRVVDLVGLQMRVALRDQLRAGRIDQLRRIRA